MYCISLQENNLFLTVTVKCTIHNSNSYLMDQSCCIKYKELCWKDYKNKLIFCTVIDTFFSLSLRLNIQDYIIPYKY
jgi:hypothetical protein